MFWGCWIWSNILPPSDRLNDVCFILVPWRLGVVEESMWVLYHHKVMQYCSIQYMYMLCFCGWFKVQNDIWWASIVTAYGWSSLGHLLPHSSWIVAYFVSTSISTKFSWFVRLALVRNKGYMFRGIAFNIVLSYLTFTCPYMKTKNISSHQRKIFICLSHAWLFLLVWVLIKHTVYLEN